MPVRLQDAQRIAVGTKQTLKKVAAGQTAAVYLAEDADATIIEPLQTLCAEHGIPVTFIPTMAELGRLCRIEVGAAAAAILR